ncbi:hypothetical protein [Endozoicomonas arenosclerae]|uniref:hypothetical protein n=1 Tax=Endozoicomonas arenosclerae TaxID=1633495 RepID=UPI0007851070|nr:hypothetical protein [Endozoicomonas arenosclerae]
MMNSTTTQPRNLFGFWTDFWLTSGLSVLVIAGMLLTGYQIETSNDGMPLITTALLLQLLLNWPHFMVSYRLLYRQPDCFKRFPGATLIVPGILVLLIALIGSLANSTPEHVSLSLLLSYGFWLIASFYLAWHYVGQAWGCFSAFTLLSGHQWNTHEKRILHWCFRSLILWHVVWAARFLPTVSWVDWLQHDTVYLLVSGLAFSGFVVSGCLLLPAWKKGQIDVRTVGIGFSLFFWYLAIFLNPAAIFWVQIAHSLQYLVFVTRVEANRPAPSHPKVSSSTRIKLIYLGCVIAGAAVFYQAEMNANLQSATPTLIGLLAIAINIHHYYVDSSIWKLRNEPTRALLFGHLKKSR